VRVKVCSALYFETSLTAEFRNKIYGNLADWQLSSSGVVTVPWSNEVKRRGRYCENRTEKTRN